MKLILLIVLTIFSIIVKAQQPVFVKEQIVLAAVLNLRAAPNTSSEILAGIPFGSKVIVQEYYTSDTITYYTEGAESNTWAKISYHGITGYALEPYLGTKIIWVSGSVSPLTIRYPYWYRIAPTDKGDLLIKTTVRLDSIGADDFSGYTRWFIVEAGEMAEDGLGVFIGSFLPLREMTIGYTFNSAEKKQAINSDSFSAKQYFVWDNRFQDYYIGFEKNKLYFGNKTTKQEIGQLVNTTDIDSYFVDWYGDMNGDKKTDFVLSSFGHLYFFMSTPKNMVELVFHQYINEGD